MGSSTRKTPGLDSESPFLRQRLCHTKGYPTSLFDDSLPPSTLVPFRRHPAFSDLHHRPPPSKVSLTNLHPSLEVYPKFDDVPRAVPDMFPPRDLLGPRHNSNPPTRWTCGWAGRVDEERSVNPLLDTGLPLQHGCFRPLRDLRTVLPRTKSSWSISLTSDE